MSDASKLSTGQSPHQSAAQLWLDRPDTGARQSLACNIRLRGIRFSSAMVATTTQPTAKRTLPTQADARRHARALAASGTTAATTGNITRRDLVTRSDARQAASGICEQGVVCHLQPATISLYGRESASMPTAGRHWPVGPSQSDAKRALRTLVTGDSNTKPKPRQVDLHSMD